MKTPSRKSHLKIRLKLSGDLQEWAASELVAFGFEGFQEEGNDVLEAWIPSERFTDRTREDLMTWLKAQPGDCRILEEQIVQERNWNEEWEKTIQPLTVGDFYIHPTWSKVLPPKGVIPIVIDPKMAFGTGYHETTRLILRMLPGMVYPGDRVLDMGTGTGVLAIAALKLGASRATGVDIDPWCFDNAGENAGLNGMADRLDIRIGSTEVLEKSEKFDLILANINRNILLDLADDLVSRLNPGGRLLLSGIIEGDEPAIFSHPAYRSMEKLVMVQENEWLAAGLRFRDSLNETGDPVADNNFDETDDPLAEDKRDEAGDAEVKAAAATADDPVAVIDIGTNTALLLVAQVLDGKITVLEDVREAPRLGKGVDKDRSITEAAEARLMEALQAHKQRILEKYGDIRVIVTATSAMRDAGNREDVMRSILEATGWEVKLLDGKQEAEATYNGALAALDPGLFTAGEKISVIDIGGGSTELAFGCQEERYEASDQSVLLPVMQGRVSLDAGCVRFTERFLTSSEKGGIADVKSVAAMRREIRKMLEQTEHTSERAVGVAGTVTSLAYIIHINEGQIQSDVINGSIITLENVRETAEMITTMTVGDIQNKWPEVMNGRSDIFLAGLIILEAYLEVFGLSELTVSTGGLRHGILLAESNFT